MKAPDRIAMAVRGPDGVIRMKKQPYTAPGKKHKWMGWPVVRGVVNFLSMMFLGMHTLTDSAKMAGEDEEELSGGAMAFTVVLALALAVGLFVLLPTFLTSIVKPYIPWAVVLNLIEGVVRIAIFVGYVAAISTMKDIRRTFMYHGAEHKTVHCYEADKPLTVENARSFTTLHPRCGTSFLVIVMIVSILMFSLIKWEMAWYWRALLRIAMLPLVAGVSYEALYLFDNPFTRALRWPGMQLQRLTTREPDDGMLEVAIAAMMGALGQEVPGTRDADAPFEDGAAEGETAEVTEDAEETEQPEVAEEAEAAEEAEEADETEQPEVPEQAEADEEAEQAQGEQA